MWGDGDVNKKYDADFVKKYINNIGYKLMNEYKDTKEKITIKDNNGFYYITTFERLLTGAIPERFNTCNLYTVNNIRVWTKINNKSFRLVSKVYNGNNNKLQWRCMKNTCGEIFEAVWGNIYGGRGCGVCAGNQVVLSNCLATKNPEMAMEWHPIKNGKLTSYDVTESSNKKVWWQCGKNPEHEWVASPNNRYGKGCPYCSGRYADKGNNLFVVNPILSEEWDYIKNKKTPKDYLPNSGKYVYWICKNDPEHKWKATIASRNYGRGCPYCSGKYATKENNLLVVSPGLASEWDYEENEKMPVDYCPNSDYNAHWICKVDLNHRWRAKISDRNLKGNGCPYCSGRLATESNNLLKKYPDLCKEWDYEKK